MTLHPLTAAEESNLARALELLGDLPAEFRYFDEYSGEERLVRDPDRTDVWRVLVDGRTHTLDFSPFPGLLKRFLKHWGLWVLGRMAAIAVRSNQWSQRKVFAALGADVFVACVSLHPMELREIWHLQVLPGRTEHEVRGLKSLLHFCCDKSLGQLRPNHADFVGSFRLPSRDKYAAVRNGLPFLTMNEESLLVDYFDELNLSVREKPGRTGIAELRAGCILLTSYQHAMRPLQIAKLRRTDVRCYSGDDAGWIVHITFETVKQRWSTSPRPLPRTYKREWTPMFRAFMDAREATSEPSRKKHLAQESFFGLSPDEVSALIVEKTTEILGHPRSANALRHTAAQRMADAGATKEELAELLGHSSLLTGLIYYDQSPTQAARLNTALALSPIYSAIVEIARTKTIDKAALLRLPSDQQIAGCPHGVPIAGIGACTSGQSLCAKNPVLSCYGCRKFLPVSDAAIHREVLDSLRPVVHQFFEASRGESGSTAPAYGQLARTLAAVEQVVSQCTNEALS